MSRPPWTTTTLVALAAAGVVVAGAGLTGLLSTEGDSATRAYEAGTSGARTSDARPRGTSSDASGGLRALPHTPVGAAPGDCGKGWKHPRAGLQVFDVHNSGDVPSEVYLKDARTGAVHGEVEGLAPGTTRPLRVDLGNGTYTFTCIPESGRSAHGHSVRVTGADKGDGGPATRPVSVHDLIPPTLDYQHWVKSRMGELVRRTDALKAALDDGDLALARRRWLTAHLVYERMGAAYGTFGEADDAINGTTAGLSGGVHDPAFTGFHRIEYGLWHGESAGGLRKAARRLADDVRQLRRDWADARMDPLDMGLRAHEILENTVQFELTGRTDYGSGSNLATARANLDGTRAVLERLRPLLRDRLPGLDGIDARMKRLRGELDGFHHDGSGDGDAGDGTGWTALDDLPRGKREKLNAEAGDLVERLANVAAVLDVRRTTS